MMWPDMLSPGTIAELNAIRAELLAGNRTSYELCPRTFEHHVMVVWIDRRTRATQAPRPDGGSDG